MENGSWKVENAAFHFSMRIYENPPKSRETGRKNRASARNCAVHVYPKKRGSKMKRLIFMEGLPGTGKTALSKWLADLLNKHGENATLLLEGDERIPCDFYQMAGIPKDVYNQLVFGDVAISGQIIETDHFVFLRIDKCPEHIANEIRR